MKKIKTLLLSGEREMTILGVILLGTEFTKEELRTGLVPLNQLIDPIINAKFECPDKVMSPFGLLTNSGFFLRVIFDGFCINLGYGQGIVYSDEEIFPQQYKIILKNDHPSKDDPKYVLDMRKIKQ